MKKVKKIILDAIEYYNEHKNFESITGVANKFGIDKTTLKTRLEQDFSSFKYQDDEFIYYLDEKEEAAVKEYIENEFLTFADIKRKYGYKSELFKIKLAICGYDTNRRYTVQFDRRKFQFIDTEEKAYWLGFITADGYNNQDRGFLSIKLGVIDKEHLQKFLNFMNSNSEIKIDK